jgi:hypothetical protein
MSRLERDIARIALAGLTAAAVIGAICGAAIDHLLRHRR